MSAGLNGWGEGGTFDCQEEGVDGQAPAGPACHGMATWIKCWRMSWTPFSCGGRKYELETAWLWYFRATLIFHHEGAAIDVEMYLLRSILIHLAHNTSIVWDVWHPHGAFPLWNRQVQKDAVQSQVRFYTEVLLTFFRFGWPHLAAIAVEVNDSDVFGLLGLHLGYHFISFHSFLRRLILERWTSRRRARWPFFLLFRRFLRLRVDIIWCLGRALQALREAQLPQEDRSNYPRWAGQGRFVVKSSLELIDASTLNTSIFFGWGKYDLLRWVHRFSNLRLNPGTGGPKHFSSCLLVLFRPYFDRWFSLYPLSFVSLEIMTALCLSCQKVSQGGSFLQA